MYSLLNVVWTWNDYFNNYGNYSEETKTLLGQVFSIISTVLWVVLGIVGAIGAVYAIYLGVQLARADEQGKRDDAKKHLITVFIAIGVTIALILVFNTFLPALISAFVKNDPVDAGGNNPEMLKPLLSLLKA